MLARLEGNWNIVTMAVGAATIAFFAMSIDRRVADMQALDDRWLQLNQDQTAEVIGEIEEVRTAQGVMLGRLDGAGGGAFLYQIGVRDGRATCEVAP